MAQWTTGSSHMSVCVYARSSCGSAEGPYIPINSCGRQRSKQHRHLSKIQVRGQNLGSQCFQDTGRRGAAGGCGTKKSMAENSYTSTSILSCLLPRELANTLSGRTYAAKGESKKAREKTQ